MLEYRLILGIGKMLERNIVDPIVVEENDEFKLVAERADIEAKRYTGLARIYSKRTKSYGPIQPLQSLLRFLLQGA